MNESSKTAAWSAIRKAAGRGADPEQFVRDASDEELLAIHSIGPERLAFLRGRSPGGDPTPGRLAGEVDAIIDMVRSYRVASDVDDIDARLEEIRDRVALLAQGASADLTRTEKGREQSEDRQQVLAWNIARYGARRAYGHDDDPSVLRYLRNTPDEYLLTHRGLGPKGLAILRREAPYQPDDQPDGQGRV